MNEIAATPFAQGTLLPRLRAVTAAALADGALQPVPTGATFIEDGGVRFFVRVLANLARKDFERKERERDSAAGRPANPFLPWEPRLFVAAVSASHVAVLNKFNVVDHHLLVITRAFEDQRTLLTERDFTALRRCLLEYDALGFYNGGVEAGASQPHKHLQLVPLPLAPEGPPVPLAPLLDGVGADGLPTAVPALPFRTAFVRFAGAGDSGGCPEAAALLRHYRALLERCGLGPVAGDDGELQRGPYCLLATREWMLAVPRSREHFDSVSVNSLGFAGALLVRNEGQLERLRQVGPMAALRETAFAAAAGSPPPAAGKGGTGT